MEDTAETETDTAVAMKTAKAKSFLKGNMSRFIGTWTEADIMAMADLLLQENCITNAAYKEIQLDKHKARKLYAAMEASDKSYLVCYGYMEDQQPLVIKDLERNKKTASEPLRKKARIEEPDQTQVQDATNETDSGSTPNFTGWTRSKLLEHVEDPVNMKHLVTSLKQRLEDSEMKQLESKLQNCALKNTVFLNHEAFRNICINNELTKFLTSKSQAKFPKLAIDQFFTGGFKGRPKPLRTQDEPEKDNGDSGTMQNWQSAEPSREQEESFDQNSLSSPEVQDMTGMDTALSLPTAQSTPCHSKMETNSIRMQKSLSVSSDNGYDTQKSSLSMHDPPQEAQREFKTSMGTLTTPSECQQSISGEAVAEDGAMTSEVTSAATPAAMASAATPAAIASAATPAAMASAATPAALASAATPATIPSAATPAAIASAVTPASLASAATPAALASASTPAAMSSAATAKSADTASSPTADTASAVIPADAASSVAVAANGALTNNGNPRKQQNRKVCKKTTEEMLRNNRKAILHEFLKQIPSTSEAVQETEELEKIKDCIITVDCREHPSYPLLLADHCIVFHKENQTKLIEIFDSAAFRKDGQLKKEFRFKVQFHMWFLDISETVVLSKKEDSSSKEIQKRFRDFFKEKEKRFQQYLHKVVVPLFAVYKKVQREREL